MCGRHLPAALPFAFSCRPSRHFPRRFLWDPGDLVEEGTARAGIFNYGRCTHAVSHVTCIHPALFLKFLQGRAKLSTPEELSSALWEDSPSEEMPGHLSLSLLTPAGISFKALCSPWGVSPTQGCPPSDHSLGLWFVVLENHTLFQPSLMVTHGQKGLDLPSVPCGHSWPEAGSPQSRGLCTRDTSRGSWRAQPSSQILVRFPWHSPHGALGVTSSMWVHLGRWHKLRKTSLGQRF